MKRFELTDDLITGLADIDEDHRELFELGNRITDPSFLNSDRQIMEDTLSLLSDYIVYHFAAEEYAMFHAGYSGFENQCLWHKNFQQQISQCIGLGKKTGITKELLAKIAFSIEKWFLEHIRIMDLGFAQFTQRQGIRSVNLPSVRKLVESGTLPKDFNPRVAKGR